MNGKAMKIFGIVATIVGMAASLLKDVIDEKKQDERIEQKVQLALAKQQKN